VALLCCVYADTDAVVATLLESNRYDDVTCSRVRDVLLAPHKHKDRNASKWKQLGRFCYYLSYKLNYVFTCFNANTLVALN